MGYNEDMKPDVERDLKWKELSIRIEHYKYYLVTALQAAAFFYAITGGVLGFYLKDPEEAKKYHLEYFLLLPILMGSVLGGIFIYGAGLQERAIDSMELIREELRERLGISIKQLYDAHLLSILLLIFGLIFFIVVSLLFMLPFLIGTPYSLYLMGFLGLAIAILLFGLLLPKLAAWIDARLKKRRITRWKDKIGGWIEEISRPEGFDVSTFKGSDFYYQVLAALSRKTIETINDEKAAENQAAIKGFLLADLQNFRNKWVERESRIQKKEPGD